MKIKMNTTACGPNGNLYENKEYTLDNEFATPLVEGGYATQLETAQIKPKEKATTATDNGKIEAYLLTLVDDKKPTVDEIKEATGQKISAKERDELWENSKKKVTK